MWGRLLLIGSAALWLLMTSCGMPGVKTLEPGEQIDLPGVSIEAPRQQGWMYAHRTVGSNHHLELFRQDDSPTHTYLAMVDVEPMTEEAGVDGLPTETELLELVKAASREQMPMSRFVPIEESFTVEPRFSDLCVCSEASAKDWGAVNAGDEPYLVLQAKSYNFVIEREDELRPVFVHISYTERGKSEEIGPDFELRAEDFFAAVELAD